MGKEVKKNFNIGWNLFNAFCMAWVTIFLFGLIKALGISPLYISLATIILLAVIAFKRKFDYFWLYPLLTFLFPPIGLTLFFYELVRYSAKNKGRKVDPEDMKKILKEIGRFILIFGLLIVWVIGLALLRFDPCKINSIYKNSSFCTQFFNCGYFCIFMGILPIYSAPLIVSACLWKKSKKWFIETLLAILLFNLIFYAGQGV